MPAESSTAAAIVANVPQSIYCIKQSEQFNIWKENENSYFRHNRNDIEKITFQYCKTIRNDCNILPFKPGFDGQKKGFMLPGTSSAERPLS